MAIFGRKREADGKEAPNLPELPNLSDNPKDSGLDNTETGDYSYSMPELSKEIKELPSFPDSKFGDSLSQEAVKSAIEPLKTNKRKAMDFDEPEFTLTKPIQIETPKPVSKPINKPTYREITQPAYNKSFSIENPPLPMTEKSQSRPLMQTSAQERSINEPVYIRIDKFKFALESFQTIKEKINEVEKYLQEVKEQKKREDEELKEWENEIEAIKLRIEGIDNKIFSKV